MGTLSDGTYSEITSPTADTRIYADSDPTGTPSDGYIELQSIQSTYYQSTDSTAVNNDATLNDPGNEVTGFVAALEINTAYRWSADIWLEQDNAAADFRITWTVPSGATGFWGSGLREQDRLSYGVSNWEAVTTALTSPDQTVLPCFGYVLMGSTAGNLQLFMTQNSATVADNWVAKGSSLTWIKLGAV